MPDLTLTGVAKSFGDQRVLHDLSLTVHDGELLTLLGPSGCGKSTTLWSIAGLHRPDAGTIAYGDRVVFDAGKVDVPPERRNCGVVFQSYAIWPHLSVAANVGYPLKLRKVKGAARRDRVREVLELVELGHLGDRYPHELSGGQQQRVALARALAHPPELLLLDEPFSNLDAKLRDRARDWLSALQRRIGVTTVFVTHDQDEALSMSDRIVVMDQGVVRQIGTPTEVYREPADLFVADFVGTANKLPGTAVAADGTTVLVQVPGLADPLRVAHADRRLGPVSLTIRPESIEIVRPGEPTTDGLVTSKIEASSYLGDHFRYTVRVGDVPVTVTTTRPVDTAEIMLRLPAADVRLFHPETPSTTHEENPHA